MILKKRKGKLRSMQKFHYIHWYILEKSKNWKKSMKRKEGIYQYAIIIMSTNVTSIHSIMEAKNAEVQWQKEKIEARYSYHACISKL